MAYKPGWLANNWNRGFLIPYGSAPEKKKAWTRSFYIPSHLNIIDFSFFFLFFIFVENISMKKNNNNFNIYLFIMFLFSRKSKYCRIFDKDNNLWNLYNYL